MMIRIKINDPKSLRSWCIKGTSECLPRLDSSVPLMYNDPSDLGSLILTWIITKQRTLCCSLQSKGKLNPLLTCVLVGDTVAFFDSFSSLYNVATKDKCMRSHTTEHFSTTRSDSQTFTSSFEVNVSDFLTQETANSMAVPTNIMVPTM